MEFNEEFYGKIVRLMMLRTTEAKHELLNMNEQVKQHYDKMGWKSFPFEGMQHSTASVNNTNEQSSSRASVIQPVSHTNTPSSMTSSQSECTLLSVSEDVCSSASSNLYVPPKKKIKVVTITSSDSEVDKVKPVKPSIAMASVVKPFSKYTAPKSDTPQHSPSRECKICGESGVDGDDSLAHCIECAQSYHQLCHQPNIRTEELNDPRFIFCCTYCKKTRADFARNSSPVAQTQQTQHAATVKKKKKIEDSTPRSPFTKTTEKMVDPQTSKGGKTEIATMAEQFLAKHKNKGSSSKNAPVALPSAAAIAARTLGSPTNPLTGLAKLAAQNNNAKGGMVGLSKLTPPASSSTNTSAIQSGSNSKTVASAATPMQSANQRLLAMKKKAAKMGK